MTWTALIMPDDALPPDSLVKRILDADKVQQDAVDAALQFMHDYDSDLQAMADREKADLPLWRVMEHAGMHEPGTPRDAIAAEIEALRDWLPRRPPKEFYGQLCAELQTYDVTMVGRTMDWLRALLTEQARIARGEA